jgi:hypothetical protein
MEKSAYLDKIEAIVRALKPCLSADGALIDPFSHKEVQYSTPYFAYAVGTLLSAGRGCGLAAAGIAAMNKATGDMARGRKAIPDNHGEFFLAPLAGALPLYKPFVPARLMGVWRDRLGTDRDELLRGLAHNWQVYAMKGEWYRAVHGLVSRSEARAWIEKCWHENQRRRFLGNEWNLYHDRQCTPDSMQYEAATRGNLMAMVAAGYDGPSAEEMRALLERGSRTSLLLQDAYGQAPGGGRTGGHAWNDAVNGALFELMAEHHHDRGRDRLAGQYRRAAMMSFESVKRCQRSSGPFRGAFSVTKNHFDPVLRVGYASYSHFTNYNGCVMFHLSEAYNARKTPIGEQPAPVEIGGYALSTDENFAVVVANAGGMQFQAALRGATEPCFGQYWTTLGIHRFSRVGWDSRLGPSGGAKAASAGVSYAPAFLEEATWKSLVDLPERYEGVFTVDFVHPLLVRCRISYRPVAQQTGPAFEQKLVMIPDGVLSTLTSSADRFGQVWPILAHDGRTDLIHEYTGHRVKVRFPGGKDEQNFIALGRRVSMDMGQEAIRGAYGDLLPVRVVCGMGEENVTFVYPRSAGDPAAEAVRNSFQRRESGFSCVLARVEGDLYVGRTSAGGVGKSIDLDGDGSDDVSFDKQCGFILQLKNGKILAVEVDRPARMFFGGTRIPLKPFTPSYLKKSTSWDGGS